MNSIISDTKNSILLNLVPVSQINNILFLWNSVGNLDKYNTVNIFVRLFSFSSIKHASYFTRREKHWATDTNNYLFLVECEFCYSVCRFGRKWCQFIFFIHYFYFFRLRPKREDKGGTIITLKIKQKEGESKSFFKKISLKDEQLESKIIQQSKCKSAFKGCTSVIRDSANTTWNEADSVKFHLTRANQRALL